MLIDRLYGELDETSAARFDTHVADCGGCQTAMDSLSATRDMFRDLPQVEPPSSLTAILLHEAAKQAPARAAAVPTASDSPSLVARIVGWLGPIMQHPAMAAAAMLVLVVGIAGTLYLRGDSKVAQPDHVRREAAVSAAGENAEPTVEGNLSALRQGTATPRDEDPSAAPAGDDEDNDGFGDGTRGRAGDKDKLAPAYGADVVSESQSQKLNLARTKGGETTGRETESDKKGYAAPSKEAKNQPEPARRTVASRDESAQAQASAAAKYRRKTKGPVVTNAVTGADPLVASDNAADLRLPVGKRTVGVGSINKGVVAKPKPRVVADAPMGGAHGGGSARPGMASPPPPASPAPVTTAPTSTAQRATPPRDPKAELAWAKARKLELDRAAKRSQCATVARIANDIRARNAGYWNANVRYAKTVKPCEKLISADWDRRIRVRGKRRYAQPKRPSGASKPPAAKAAPAEAMSDSAE